MTLAAVSTNRVDSEVALHQPVQRPFGAALARSPSGECDLPIPFRRRWQIDAKCRSSVDLSNDGTYKATVLALFSKFW